MKHTFSEGRTAAKIIVSYKKKPKKTQQNRTGVIAVPHVSVFLLLLFPDRRGKSHGCARLSSGGEQGTSQEGAVQAAIRTGAFWRGSFHPGPVWCHRVTSLYGWGLAGACLYCGLELAMAQGIAFAHSKPIKCDTDGAGQWSGNLFQKPTPKETGSP